MTTWCGRGCAGKKLPKATAKQLDEFFDVEAYNQWRKRCGRAATEANALVRLAEGSVPKFSAGILAALGQEAFRQVVRGEVDPATVGRWATLFMKARSDERTDQMQELKREQLRHELEDQIEHALDKLAEEVEAASGGARGVCGAEAGADGACGGKGMKISTRANPANRPIESRPPGGAEAGRKSGKVLRLRFGVAPTEKGSSSLASAQDDGVFKEKVVGTYGASGAALAQDDEAFKEKFVGTHGASRPTPAQDDGVFREKAFRPRARFEEAGASAGAEAGAAD